jgi:hypothetical protein
MQNVRDLDVDGKDEVVHVEKPAYVESDPRLAGIATELAWAHGLSEEELATESKKLLRKVRSPHRTQRIQAHDQVDWRLMPTLFVLIILNYLDRNALA